MFKIHGVNMFPSQVEELLSHIDGATSEYRITLAHEDDKNRDVILVTVEAEGRVHFEEVAKKLTTMMKSRIGVTPRVTVVPEGTLPRSEKKTKRVIDYRA